MIVESVMGEKMFMRYVATAITAMAVRSLHFRQRGGKARAAARAD
jgi:hypothetical protein